MEISLKTVVAIAIAGVSGLGALNASADIVNTDTGNGELTLFVRNELTGAVYARGLQIQLDSILTESAIQSGPYNAGVSNERTYVLPAPIGPDANLASFLGQAGTFHLPPTRVEALYAPERFGESPNTAIEVAE